MAHHAVLPPAGESLSERAYRLLRDKLVLLDIRPGEPLHEASLGEEFGVGRTPVREAIKRLETDRLVVSFARRGTFASAVDITELAEISEVRLALEPLAARRAAEVHTAADRPALTDVRDRVAALTATADHRTLMELDLAVHQAIYAAAGNDHLADVLERFDYLATRIWCLTIDRMSGVVGHMQDHVGVIDAILARDGARAEAMTRAHITAFERDLRAVL